MRLVRALITFAKCQKSNVKGTQAIHSRGLLLMSFGFCAFWKPLRTGPSYMPHRVVCFS